MVLTVGLAATACSSGDSGSSSKAAESPSATRAKAADANPGDTPAPTGPSGPYTPTGTLIADTGFRPEADGFGVENYGADVNGAAAKNLGPVEMRKLFGDGVCTDATAGLCDLTPEAQAWMTHTNTSMAGGHCYGFSVASLLFFKKQQAVADFGGDATPALSVGSSQAVQQNIAYGWALQTLDSVNAAAVKGTPNEVLDRLIAALKPDAPDTYTIGIYKADGSGGHAVTPYAVEDKGDGKMNVLIYDNNYPKITRAMAFDRTSDKWTYDAATNPSEPSELYQGDATTKSFELDPTNPGLAAQPCPFCNKVSGAPSNSAKGSAGASKGSAAPLSPMDQIYLEGSNTIHGHLLITNPAGQRLGFVDGKVVNEIPGAKFDRTFSDQDWKNSIEPDYFVPDGPKYSISIDGSVLQTTDSTSVGVISPSSDLSVDDILLKPGEKDTLTFEKDATNMAFTAGNPQKPTFTLGVSDDAADYAFTLKASTDAPGATINLGLPAEAGSLRLSASGTSAPVTFSLAMDRDGDKDVKHFKADKVTLAPGDTADLQFGNWDVDSTPIPLVTNHGGVESTESLSDQG